MMIDFVLLAHSASRNEHIDKKEEAWSSKVPF